MKKRSDLAWLMYLLGQPQPEKRLPLIIEFMGRASTRPEMAYLQQMAEMNQQMAGVRGGGGLLDSPFGYIPGWHIGSGRYQ